MGELVADFTQEFYRRSLAVRFTATWCGYCPTMASSIDAAIEMVPGRLIPFTLHATDSQGGLAYSGTSNFAGLYQISGYPSGRVNGYAAVKNYQVSTGKEIFAGLATEAVSSLPSKTNIGGFVSVAGGQVDAMLSVAVKEAGTYKISAFVLEDGIQYQQDGAGSDYTHNYVVRKEMTGIYGNEFSTSSANETKEFNFSIPVPSSVINAANLHVVVYVTYAGSYTGSVSYAEYVNYGIVIDNVVDIKANDLCDFKYE